MSITPEQEQLIAEYQSLITRQWFPSVCPIFDSDRKRPLRGSSVLLQIGNKNFLITAAHVLDPIFPNSKEKKEDLFIAAHGNFELLADLTKGFILSTQPRSGNRDDDRFDFAYAELIDNAPEILEEYRFLTINDVEPNYRANENKPYLILGWPVNQTKLKFKEQGKEPGLEQKYLSLLSHLAGDEIYKAIRKSPIEHILLPFVKEQLLGSSGNLLNGMSGGAILCVHNELPIKDSQKLEKLVGIGIEYLPSKEVIIGTRIAFILEKIRIDYPELSKHIPYGAFNLKKF